MLTTDIGAWRAYADALRAIYPEIIANQAMADAVGKMEGTQQAAIAQAETMGWTADAFDMLGRAAFGVGGDQLRWSPTSTNLAARRRRDTGHQSLGLAMEKLQR